MYYLYFCDTLFFTFNESFSVAKNKQAENDLVIVCCFNLLKSQKKNSLPTPKKVYAVFKYNNVHAVDC